MKTEQYAVRATRLVDRDLKAIKDSTVHQHINKALLGLASKPVGKPLSHHPGYFSVPCGKTRFRILFQVDHQRKVVTIAVIAKRQQGHHSDVYEIARRRL